MKPWNGKFSYPPSADEMSPDYAEDGCFDPVYSYVYWWEDMRPREVRDLVEQAFKAGYQRRRDEEKFVVEGKKESAKELRERMGFKPLTKEQEQENLDNNIADIESGVR